MKGTISLILLTAAIAGVDSANGAVSLYAEYRLGEPGTVDGNNAPLDSVGSRDITVTINPLAVSVGTGGAYAGSSAFLDTSDPTNSGYYNDAGGGNFSDLATDNVAIGVYAKAASIAGNTGTIFGTGNLGLDLSLQDNGWAGSIFNVAWASEAGGVTGSFAADT